MAEQVVVRRASVDDVAAIQRIGLLTWPATYLPIAPPDHVVAGLAEWWTSEAVLAAIDRATTFVAEVRGEVVGTATVGAAGDAPVLWKLYVLPEHQGAGVATALLRHAVAAAGPRALRTEYLRGNARAARFSAREGFAITGEEPGDHGTTTVWCARPAPSVWEADLRRRPGSADETDEVRR